MSPPPRAVIFDLDTALLDQRQAWRYALEQAVAAVCGRSVDARTLPDEYHHRPAADALAILVDDARQRALCAQAMAEIEGRSAIKHLLVYDGLGMALDRLRQAEIELGAISRRPHALARRQVEATALVRFLSVLSATPEGSPWAPDARLGETLGFLGHAPGECVYVTSEEADRERVTALGWATIQANWGGMPAGSTTLEIQRTLDPLAGSRR